jgi:hypothetical protein
MTLESIVADDLPGDAFLHIYLVERTDDVPEGELAGYVVCAASERQARELAPAPGFGASVVVVTHWGIAINGTSPGVIWPRPKSS